MPVLGVDGAGCDAVAQQFLYRGGHSWSGLARTRDDNGGRSIKTVAALADAELVTLYPESGSDTPTGIGGFNGSSKDVGGVAAPTCGGGIQNWRTRPTTLPAMRNSPLPSVTMMGSKASFSGMRRMPWGGSG